MTIMLSQLFLVLSYTSTLIFLSPGGIQNLQLESQLLGSGLLPLSLTLQKGKKLSLHR